MISHDTAYTVKNRSSSIVVYRIPETNIRREFQPGETKRISFGELEKLTYQPGGRALIEEFLQIIDDEVTTNLNVHREYEYDMSEVQIRDLLLTGSLDAFLDALDFAPIGVIDLIKTLSVSLPLTDLNKRKALKDKTGFDVDRALVHIEEELMEEQNAAKNTAGETLTRRVTPPVTSTTRRTTPKYKITSTTEPMAEPSDLG